MADTITKYIWIVDTIKRYGRITRNQINEAWLRSPLSNGMPLSRRTFYNYKNAIEEVFNITIECDPSTFEYYISEENSHEESLNNWILNSAATNSLITSSRDVSTRVFLEEVPSAREFLKLTIESLRAYTTMKFDYHPYTRSLPTRGVVIEPYFTKIFKQRWYVIGRNVKEGVIKTYALDRISNAVQLNDHFELPADFDADEYFRDAFGIVVDKSYPKKIKIMVDCTQAKYFRALPLHHSQTEMLHDQYSIFEYQMRITPDLINELLSYGPRITVLSPKELKTAIVDSLRKTLKNYELASDER